MQRKTGLGTSQLFLTIEDKREKEYIKNAR